MTKSLKDGVDAVVADLDAAEILQPCVGSLDFPAALISAQFASILEAAPAHVLAIGHDQFGAQTLESLPQRIGVVATISDDTAQVSTRATPSLARHTHLLDRALRQPAFGNLRGRELDSERYAVAVDHHHALRTFPTTRLADCGAPFFAVMKVASRKASSQSRNRFWSSIDSSLRQAVSQTPSSSHFRSLRQQVDPSGYAGDKSRHRAPLRSTHKMPSRQARFGVQGRPRPSLRRLGSGNKGSSTFHWASLRNACRLFCLMAKDQQAIRLTRKYLP